MKPFLFFTAIFFLLGQSFSLAGGQKTSLPGQVPVVDKSGYYSGTPYIELHHEEIIRNTSLLHPELPKQLNKSAGIQHEIGDTLDFFVVDFTTNSRNKISAVCRHKTDKTYIFVGLKEWSSEKVIQNDVDQFNDAFEVKTPAHSIDPNKGIREIVETTFGQPPNKTGDGYVYILIHDIIDDYSKGNSKSYVAGYFSRTDQTNSSYSNKKDIIYVDCDPGNPSGNSVLATVSHEFQHLIHYGLDPNEASWVNEGASEYSEELCGYGLRSPSRFLQHPERSLLTFSEYKGDILVEYAKVALWTHYLGEKFGNELIRAIVRNPLHSVAGVRDALTKTGISLSFEQIFENFVVANFANNPSLGENGYWGYSKISIASLSHVSGTYQVYPVDKKQFSLPRYASAYFRFTAPDSTAILYFNGTVTGDISAQIYKTGNDESVTTIEMGQNNRGIYPLKEIGKSVSEIILIPTSLGNSNSYDYSVTTEIEDISPPQITSGPNESLPTGSSVTIFWETDEAATSLVEYGVTSNYDMQVNNTKPVTEHQIVLKNLQQNTTYYYRIGSVDAHGNGPTFSIDFSFTTNSITSQKVRTVKQTHSFGYQGRNLVRDSRGVLHLIYHEVDGSRRFVFHIQSADGGDNWSAPVQIDDTNYYGGMPSAAIDKLNRIHVAWHAKKTSGSDYSIYYCRSDDGGNSWSAPVTVSKTVTGKDQLYAAIAIDKQNNPHIVWNTVEYSDKNEGDIYHNFSLDGGDSWQTDKRISTSDEHLCFVPTIDFTSTGTAFVFYADGDFEQASRKVYFISSEDYQNWTNSSAVSSSGALYDGLISFVVDSSDQIHVVYADNFTPGDIRILYSRYADGIWQAAVPVAQSTTGGIVSYPNISADENKDIYLVYRDDMKTSALGKLVQKQPVDDRKTLAKKLNPKDKGEIFLSIRRKGKWQPAANLSNDEYNSEYPELPGRLSNGKVDLIWMNEISSTVNNIRFLHLDTKQTGDSTPPQISAVFPADGATDVSYFKEQFYLTVEFNQRIETDSLIPANVIIKNSAGQPIAGEITFQESLRLMKFTPANNLTANDSITVRLTTHISNLAGIGLDGNGNGIAEGSPVDDFIWTFHTEEEDTQAPTFTIGVLQNPVLTKYLDIYVISSERLAELPALKIGTQSVSLALNNGQAHIYKGDYKLHEDGVLQIEASGTDLAGNVGLGRKSLSARLMLVEPGGAITSPDGRLQLFLPPGSIRESSYFTISKKDRPGDEIKKLQNDSLPIYQIGPNGLRLNHPASLSFKISKLENTSFQLEQQTEDGAWQKVDAENSGDFLLAKINRLSDVRIMATEETLPQHFALHQNYPNPFSEADRTTTLMYELPVKDNIKITIYNLLGKKIRTLIDQTREPGKYRISWDGKDERNQRVASGIYFYQLKTTQSIFTQKMLVLR